MAGVITKEKFHELFSEFGDPVFRFFMIKTRGEVDLSEDLVQETFLKVWRAREKYDASRPFNSWVFSIAYNTWVDNMRKAKPSESIDDYEIADKTPGPEEKVHYKLILEKVYEELKEFPEDAREIVMLSYVSGLSSAEISKIVGKKPSAIRMIRMRSIEKLQNIIKKGPAEIL